MGSMEHAEVICPVCAALPGGGPTHVTDDSAAHLTLKHRAPRGLDQSRGVPHVRKMFPPGWGLGSPHAHRSNMHLLVWTFSSEFIFSSNREAVGPVAELFSQLSGMRHSARGQFNSSSPSAAQLEQMQLQLQLEKQQTQAAWLQTTCGKLAHWYKECHHYNHIIHCNNQDG